MKHKHIQEPDITIQCLGLEWLWAYQEKLTRE